MPLVRISYTSGQAPSFATLLSKGVHRAMVDTFNVPETDYFQVLSEHDAGTGLVWPDVFLGIEHGDNPVFVQITCAEGRTVAQKKALYRAIVDNIEAVGIAPNDVIINLIETKKENWSFGNGDAPFA